MSDMYDHGYIILSYGYILCLLLCGILSVLFFCFGTFALLGIFVFIHVFCYTPWVLLFLLWFPQQGTKQVQQEN